MPSIYQTSFSHLQYRIATLLHWTLHVLKGCYSKDPSRETVQQPSNRSVCAPFLILHIVSTTSRFLSNCMSNAIFCQLIVKLWWLSSKPAANLPMAYRGGNDSSPQHYRKSTLPALHHQLHHFFFLLLSSYFTNTVSMSFLTQSRFNKPLHQKSARVLFCTRLETLSYRARAKAPLAMTVVHNSITIYIWLP